LNRSHLSDQHAKLSRLIERSIQTRLCAAFREILQSATGSINFVSVQLKLGVMKEAFTKFRSKQTQFLVSTEIPTHRIDISEIETLVNADTSECLQNSRSEIAFPFLTSPHSKSVITL
jgi:hypothetical protein